MYLSSSDADSGSIDVTYDYDCDNHQDLTTTYAPPRTVKADAPEEPRTERPRTERPRTSDAPEVIDATPAPLMVYHQVDTAWQASRKGAFQLSFAKTKLLPIHSGRLIVPTTTEPSLKHQTLGDGNCFFRTISALVTGEDTYHSFIRGQVCTFLQTNAEGMLEITQSPNYLQTSNMFSDREWATEVEIFACATMLNTVVYVYTQSGKTRNWLKHEPICNLVSENLLPTDRALYISNISRHFEPVLKLHAGL